MTDAVPPPDSADSGGTPPAHRPRPPLAVTPAGIIGTLLLMLVVAACVRLGFWQLSRHEERRERNAQVAARLHAPAVADAAALADTAGLFYRTAAVSGRYDNDRAIVLPGRSLRGVPGVHLVMPLQLDGRGDAVLVNRGWVPAPDAATIDPADFTLPEAVAVEGLVLPFPGRDQSLAQRQQTQRRDEGFRRVWYDIDEAALRAQFPYPLLPVLIQALPEEGAVQAGRAGYPARLVPPPLDEGPHLGYALQWFAFALIGLIGWVALVLRDRAPPRAVAPPVAALVMLLAAGSPAAAQLRPLEPAEWRIFDSGVRLIADGGGALLRDQRASLAGTSGTLLEGGNYAATFRSGRIAISLSGTAVLRLSDEIAYLPPADDVSPVDGSPRQDAGRAVAATLLRLSPARWPVDVIVHFGAVLPTTSHTSGLDRDRTDFFALAGFRFQRGPVTLTTEQGVGINGTVYNDYPQSDVWAYNGGVAVDLPRDIGGTAVRGVVQLVGHQDGHGRPIRGNEKQREVRAGVDIGRDWLLRLRYIHGLTDFSPSGGVRISGARLVGRGR